MERNQGPSKLDCCVIDNAVLANGLRGNSRLGEFSTRLLNHIEVSNREALAIADALRENEGLVNLTFHKDVGMSDEAWHAVCDSLKMHPTLQVLGLCCLRTYRPAPMAPDVITSRTQALLDMMKVNISIHTIHLDFQHQLFRESVIPCLETSLETNRLRPRLLAIQQTRPVTYRAKVLGRALLSARTDANSFWMLLSGNAEVSFPPRTTTIAAATNLPTPSTTTAAAAATSTANVAAVAASVMSAVTTTATRSVPAAAAPAAPSTASASVTFAFASTAANVATPSAGQKKKARP
jgi:hypothetical protein